MNACQQESGTCGTSVALEAGPSGPALGPGPVVRGPRVPLEIAPGDRDPLLSVVGGWFWGSTNETGSRPRRNFEPPATPG
jgi:hypothetical protein